MKEMPYTQQTRQQQLKHLKWQWVEYLEQEELYRISTTLELRDIELLAQHKGLQTHLKNKARTPRQRKLVETLLEDIQATMERTQ